MMFIGTLGTYLKDYQIKHTKARKNIQAVRRNAPLDVVCKHAYDVDSAVTYFMSECRQCLLYFPRIKWNER